MQKDTISLEIAGITESSHGQLILPVPKVEPIPQAYDEQHPAWFKTKRPRQVRLIEDFTLQQFRIKAGTIWDGSSIPRYFWRFVGTPFDPLSLAASLIHDELYKLGQWTYHDGSTHPLSRTRADIIYYEYCILYGVPIFEANWRYRGLRVGGGSSWKRYRALDKQRGPH